MDVWNAAHFSLAFDAERAASLLHSSLRLCALVHTADRQWRFRTSRACGFDLSPSRMASKASPTRESERGVSGNYGLLDTLKGARFEERSPDVTRKP